MLQLARLVIRSDPDLRAEHKPATEVMSKSTLPRTNRRRHPVRWLDLECADGMEKTSTQIPVGGPSYFERILTPKGCLTMSHKRFCESVRRYGDGNLAVRLVPSEVELINYTLESCQA